MAVKNFIQQVQQAAKDRPKSTEWYKDKIKEFGTPKTLDLIRDGKQSKSPFGGVLNMFVYAPKFAKKLPYYDTFPLVLPIESYSDGFLGINLHYLPIPLRIRLLDRLTDFSNNTKFDKTTTLGVSYSQLKNVRLIRPTLKRYLAGKVKSRFRRVDADEFIVATLLPVARFTKASAAQVHRDSRKML